MLLGFEFIYINKRVILTRHKSSIHNIIFKYCISIILTDIIICSVCKTLYLYVSSVYTVMWHDISMPFLWQSNL